MPKISVIVPIYGVEKYLRKCVDSILNQTFTDFELILLDDGGKDSCPQIIDEYAQQDTRVVVVHKSNGGYGHTCNTGLEKATGEYISIIEPDDYIEPNMFEDLYNIAKQYDSDIVKSAYYDNLVSHQKTVCKIEIENDDRIPQNRSFTIEECPLFLYYHPSIWSCIYKREFLNKHNIRFVEAPGAGWTDNLFQVQTMCLAEKINYTSNAYYYWLRVNPRQEDDLKDWTLPFKRSDEIHDWMNEQNITNPEVWACLYSREMAYIDIVLGKDYNYKILKEVYKAINKLTSYMDDNIIKNSQLIKKRNKKRLLRIKHHLKIHSFITRFIRFRKDLVSIKFNSEEKSITLFSKTWQINR